MPQFPQADSLLPAHSGSWKSDIRREEVAGETKNSKPNMKGLSYPTDEQISPAIAIKMFSFLHAHGRRKENLILNANLRKKRSLAEE